ncbi:MAG: nitroreductase [Chloroflexi bacterium]|nr:nitroreductase [Chloroflexota bacterium]
MTSAQDRLRGIPVGAREPAPLDLLEAIRLRKSIRAFRPDPVPREALERALALAQRAASWSNLQPWEYAVVTGPRLRELSDALVAFVLGGEEPRYDFERPVFQPVHQRRRVSDGIRLFDIAGIHREDPDYDQKRADWRCRNMRLFGAPVGVFIYMERQLHTPAVLDIGGFVTTLMLACLPFGLGTCASGSLVGYPDLLRQLLGLPDSKMFLCGVCVGYPDWDAPLNTFGADRDPLEMFWHWHGWD